MKNVLIIILIKNEELCTSVFEGLQGVEVVLCCLLMLPQLTESKGQVTEAAALSTTTAQRP